MTLAEALHSRIVRTLRIVLPLVALTLLSTLFLISREVDPSRALPYATVDAEDLARDPRITGPRLSGMTDDGTAVTLTAATVRISSGNAETLSAEGVDALFTAADGGQNRVTADAVRLDRLTDLMTLSGNVRLASADGWRVDSGLMLARLDRTLVQSPGPVTARAPAGQLTAGAMTLNARPAEAGTPTGHRLLFTGGVRLLYHPDAAGD